MAVILNLLRAANRVQQDLETKVYRPAGLSGAAFNVLFAIYSVGPTTPMDLARLSSVSPASISSVLNTLERSGLLKRQPSQFDKRSVLVNLTDLGREAIGILFTNTNNRSALWSNALTKEEGKLFAQLARKIIRYHPPPATEEAEALIPPTARRAKARK